MTTKSLRVIVAMLATAACVEPLSAQPSNAEPAESTLLQLNRGIYLYLDRDLEGAREVFREIRTSDAESPLAVTSTYYLGLIALEEGLRNSTIATDAALNRDEAAAKRETAVTQAALREANEEFAAQQRIASEAAEAASERFDEARQLFSEIYGRDVDRETQMVTAALLLGIAQLASDAGKPAREALLLSQQAEEVLLRYCTQTDIGATDRFGYFYLAVAQYRLVGLYRDVGQGGAGGAALANAERNLAKARELALADAEAGRIEEENGREFETVVVYYEALVSLLKRDFRDSAAKLSLVVDRLPPNKLRINAQAILERINVIETTSPNPLTLPVPEPIGPWEITGRLSIGNNYDTNVILLGRDTALPLAFQKNDDYQFMLEFDADVSRYWDELSSPIGGRSLIMGLGGGTTNFWQPEISEFDLNQYRGRAFVNWQAFTDLYLGVDYEYSYTQLGHEPFISSNRITPSVSYQWRRTPGNPDSRQVGRTDVYYVFDDRNYLEVLDERALDRDGTYQIIGLQHTFYIQQARDLWNNYYAGDGAAEAPYFGDDWLRARLGYAYRDERTRGTEFDLRGHSILWGAYVPLPRRFGLELEGEFAWSDYSGGSIFDYEGKERFEFLHRYELGVLYWIKRRGEDPLLRTLEVMVRGGVELVIQDANIWNRLGEDIYEYTRAIYGVRLEVGF